nr:hypothetical protein [Tanacetum cinerariifolium]
MVVIVQEVGIDVDTYSDPSAAQEHQDVVLEHESVMDLAHDDPNEHYGIDVTYLDPNIAQEQNNQDVVLEHESDMDLAHDDQNEHNDPSFAQEQNNQNVVLEHASDMDLAHNDPNEHNGHTKQECNKQPINGEDMEDDEVDDNAKLEEDDVNNGYDKDEDDE